MMFFDIIAEAISIYVRLLEKLFQRISIRFRGVRIGPLEFELKKGVDSPFEKTLEKIELTKDYLSEAIGAIENLKSEVLDKKRELEDVISSLNLKNKEKEALREEYNLSKRLLAEESEKLKAVLGLYEIKESRTGKVVGFIGGVLASLVASLLYAGIYNYFK